MIPTEIGDEMKPVTTLSLPIFRSKMSTFTTTSNPVVLQNSEHQESRIPSQFPKHIIPKGMYIIWSQ